MRRHEALPVLPLRARRRLLGAGLGTALAATGRMSWAGIPIRSLPRLIRLQDELPAVDPGQLRLAVQLDERAAHPRGAPALQLTIHPAVPGAFAPLDTRLAMQPRRVPEPPPGLPAAGPGRAWLAWELGPEARQKLGAAQARVRELQAMPHGRDRVRVVVAVDQGGLLPADPALARTHWEAWLSSAAAEGWYPIWTGTVLELAEESRAQS